MAQEVAIHDEKAQKMLTKAMAKVKEVGDGGRAFAMALGAVIFSDIMDHFEKAEGPSGRWHPWSAMYAAHMQKIGKGGNKLLQDTGTMRQAFFPHNFRKVGEGILWFNPAKTKQGFAYAAHHNQEAENENARRIFMFTSDDASERIADVTLKFVLDKD